MTCDLDLSVLHVNSNNTVSRMKTAAYSCQRLIEQDVLQSNFHGGVRACRGVSMTGAKPPIVRR